MKIEVSGLGKKFGREWIFRNLDFNFNSGEPVAVIGPNGSGKSTFLQVISGILPQSKGSVKYFTDQNLEISVSEIYKHISYAAPYLELIEELTLSEFLSFHIRFKPLPQNISSADFIKRLNFENAAHKQIKVFSSGMKQRLKLGLALFSQTGIILLDEPTANMDHKGVEWYLENIETVKKSKILIICSNQNYEYSFCKSFIDIKNFKDL